MQAVMKYAIFDLDGTLLDYEGVSGEAFDIILKRFGKRFSPSLHSAILGSHHSFWSKHVLQETETDQHMTPDELVHAYHEVVESLFSTMPLMPGAKRLLRTLKSINVPIAIATSSASHVVPKKIAFHPIFAECVDVIVTGDDPLVKNGKPSPDIFILAAERLGCNANELSKCVVFEDSPFGVLGGIRAGMRTVAIPDTRFLTEDAIAKHADIFTHPNVLRVASLGDVDCHALFHADRK